MDELTKPGERDEAACFNLPAIPSPPSLLRWSLVFCKPHAFSVPLGPIRKRGTAFLPACLRYHLAGRDA